MTTDHLLIATQLSGLFPSSHVASIALQTSRRNLPLAQTPQDSESLLEHASFSSVLHSESTGSVLLRVIHGGLIIELVSLSSQIPSIRFVFPAPVLSAPAMFLWADQELHLLAVTSSGSLYRLVLSIDNPTRLWHGELRKNWCREYLIKNASEASRGIVQIQGILCVAIGLENGSLLQIETERLGDDNSDDLWTESLSGPSAFFLGNITSYLPGLHSGGSAGSQIISLASHPQPTELGHIWTLSRDRTLRLWTSQSGCVASKTLSALTSVPSSSSSGIKSHLLEAEHRVLLRVFSLELNDERPFALTFTPTPSTSQSGGYFQLFDSSSDQLREIQTIPCSSGSIRCHLQDFIIRGDMLYALWEKQGSSMVEKIKLYLEDKKTSYEPLWESADYGEEMELTPAYLDELLLSPGSLADKFLEAIMRPGVFSTLTLRTALDQYMDACLSLPGPPPLQLTSSYSTLAENIAAVVGCTVNLIQDPHTGALQHAQFWSALKRDWEGFVARCREVERGARWPLALSKGPNKNDVLVIERERVGILALEDLPLRIHRHLSDSLPVESHFAVLDILWTLCDKLGHESLLNLESRVVDILHQEIAFSIVDIIQDQAQRSNFWDDLDEGFTEWIFGRLQSVDDLDRDIRIILDLVAGFDQDVKREEDEVELLLPSTRSDWTTALAAVYVSTSVHARYDICLSVVTLIFFLAESLKEWDPSLVEEVFAVFRGLAMLRSVARQPAGDFVTAQSNGDGAPTTEDVIARMSNMHVSRHNTRFSPTYSLVHRLLAQSGETGELPQTAHRFLDATGLLQSTSPAHVTHFEALFCERLRLLGYNRIAQQLIGWLPRTAGVVFVSARLLIDCGRADDAAHLMEKISGSFGSDSGLSFEDAEALASVLPGGALFDSEFTFYLSASVIFKSSAHIQQGLSFAQLALSIAPPDAETEELWFNIIRGYIDLALYDDAYASITTTPYDNLKRECVSQLVYRMCEENAIEQLMTYNFAGVAVEVEDALAFKSRNTDPRVRPFYSRILYTWYTNRGDHRSAARTMYQRAHKLQETTSDSVDAIPSMEEQLEAYLLAINSLSLIDSKAGAYIITPTSNENILEPRKRRKLSKNIPETAFGIDKPDSEVVDLANMQFDYTLLSARLYLIRRDPTLLSAADVLLSPSAIVLRLGQANQFDRALATGRTLKVDLRELFSTLTGQCLRLARNPDDVLQEDTSDWLLTDRVSSWPGTPTDRGWRYLRLALERHDNVDTDYQYSKTVLETKLSLDSASPPPPWLISSLEEHHPEHLIRTSLRFELVESALEQTLSLIRKTDSKQTRGATKAACSTWIPYTLIDQVLVAAATSTDLTPCGQGLRQDLQTEVNNRIKRMQKMSHFSI
ncbi:nucleoporin Nup120/160-domain-containing protein [Hygrophoropsis aurantiaca]|uniref:Nucleoporin Nup120/160-domain-containing protein n=1 Tax=Hygrophoropsis aurantiaca TaxID=72124 RepID=A0ACB8AT66_9AGAM|nr:nucleoporin Nup120/160-domain-containing protein [Hygrophoropsis aurantiaca]